MSTLVLSPSRAGDFKTCPQLFKFRAVDKLPEPPSLAATRGTVVHLALQRLFDHSPAARSLDTALGELEAAWEGVLDGETRELLFPDGNAEGLAREHAQRYVRNYFRLEHPPQLQPAGREIRLRAAFADLEVVGVLDRVDRRPDGTWVVSDYKTGRTPDIDRSLGSFFGLEVYAVLFHEVFGEVPDRLRLLYLDTADTYMLEPERRDIDNTKRLLAALAGAIVRAATRDDWRPRKSGFCKVCAFQPTCPAWAGALTANGQSGSEPAAPASPQNARAESAPAMAGTNAGPEAGVHGSAR